MCVCLSVCVCVCVCVYVSQQLGSHLEASTEREAMLRAQWESAMQAKEASERQVQLCTHARNATQGHATQGHLW